MKRDKFIALSKMELFRQNKPIECKTHGFHSDWRESKKSNVQCLKCAKERAQKDRIKWPITYMLRDAKAHARKKKILFDISHHDIRALLKKQDNKCALSDIPFSEEMFSIDKIDPFGHYISGNIQLVTITINRMKSNLPQDRFLTLCRKIAKHLPN